MESPPQIARQSSSAQGTALAAPVSPEPWRAPPPADVRIHVRGKFLYAGDVKFEVRGVTYGPFRPTPEGCEYHDEATVARDFRLMAAAGCNAVRVYTVPPRWLLDSARAHGLRVMVGLPWEQHVAFLDDRGIARRVVASVRAGVESCARHPALLCFVIGNEIPAPIVRWHGARAVERFIARLYRVAKRADPDTLVTYVSYPTTEYLRLPFLDFITFNVYLEDQRATADYISRLQSLAGELPLVMAEIGLDSQRNGEHAQAESLVWQLRTIFRGGCAGTFVFAFTDEWYRGGHEIEDWSFGLVTRDRRPKPALAGVRDCFTRRGPPPTGAWPMISVVVCSYNGATTIHETLAHIERLDYDNFEVLVVDDGSTDDTPTIASAFKGRLPLRLLSGPNAGLSSARNKGMTAARGDIVAYIDDDAYPDPDWLTFLALGFATSDHVGVGGPNLAPPDDGFIADCVASSPGGPCHVMATDELAEHLPGCNMALRREALLAIGGFDTRFRIAGDDVDLCWRLSENGGTLGFHPAAVVWHHRRGRVATYLKQQLNYGRAEAMLERKWPEKYNRFGHVRWTGRLYGRGHTRHAPWRAGQIDHGVWGTRLFQSIYTAGQESSWCITLMPEWYLVTAGLALLTALGWVWPPMAWCGPLLALAVALPLAQVVASVAQSSFTSRRGPSRSRLRAARLFCTTAALHVIQPLARLLGRLERNLTPWRSHGLRGFTWPRRREFSSWSEVWHPQVAWLTALERALQGHRVLVRRGGDFDRWDLHAGCGQLGGARLLTTLEEHGSGKQLLRVRAWPRVTPVAALALLVASALAVAAAGDRAWAATAVFACGALWVLVGCLRECGAALCTVQRAVQDWHVERVPR